MTFDNPPLFAPTVPARTEPAPAVMGPCSPSANAAVVQRPLGLDAARITGGMWRQWQQVNREISLPIAIERLEIAGNLGNFRIAAGELTGEFIDPVFMDSDVHKVLEAIAWELAAAPDPELERFYRDTVELLESAQEPSGYLDSWGQLIASGSHFENLEFSHELYCAGHLIQAAVAANRTIGDDRLLGVAVRLADHLVDVFLVEDHPGIDGHPEVETALVELFRLTGDPRYLELARHFVEARGRGTIAHPAGASYVQDHLPFREVDTLVGHAVRALYLESGALDVAAEGDDPTLLAASIRHWEDTIATKTAITGGHGSRYEYEAFGDRFELTPDRSYNETCAAIGSIHWNWRLLLATGEARYADLIERTLFNAFAVSTSHDARRFFYSNLMQRRSDHLDGSSRGERSEWFSCACCPPNVMRLVSSLAHYLATVAGDTLFVQQLIPAELRADLDQGGLAIELATGLPWSGHVSAIIRSAPDAPVSLAFRIPSWSPTPAVTVDDGPAQVVERDGYLVITRAWRTGEVVDFDLDLTPRKVFPHGRIDSVRGTMALERGPLVFCLEQVDQEPGVDVEEIALVSDASIDAGEPEDLPGLGRTVLLRMSGVAEVRPVPTGLPYGPALAADPVSRRPIDVRAIPYFQWDNRNHGAMRIWTPVVSGKA